MKFYNKLLLINVSFFLIAFWLFFPKNTFSLAISEIEPSKLTFLTILHTNDIHGIFQSDDAKYSLDLPQENGLLRISSLIKEIRAANNNILLLDAGDLIQSTPMMEVFEGEPMFAILNKMNYDAIQLGNHDFDMGLTALEQRLNELKIPVLGANIQIEVSERNNYPNLSKIFPYIVKEIAGIKIGIFGILTPETIELEWPPYIKGLQIISPVETAKKYLEELRNELSVDVVILLSHLGAQQDILIASEVQGIDIIIGGHSHTSITPLMKIGSTVIANTGSRGAFLGRIDIALSQEISKGSRKPKFNIVSINGVNGQYWQQTIKKNVDFYKQFPNSNLIKPTLDTPLDEELQAVYNPYKQKIDDILSEEIGETWVALPFENIKKQSTLLGNQLADLLKKGTASDLAVIDTTTIDNGIKDGKIKKGDLYNIFRHYTRQNVLIVKIKGKTILEMLKHAVNNEKNRLLIQISGLIFRYRIAPDKSVEMETTLVNKEPLQADDDYTLAVTSHLIMGDSGFGMLKEVLDIKDTYQNLRNIIAKRIKEERFLWATFENRIEKIE